MYPCHRWKPGQLKTPGEWKQKLGPQDAMGTKGWSILSAQCLMEVQEMGLAQVLSFHIRS